MADINSICRQLQLENNEEKRKIILDIVREYENQLGALSLNLHDNQKYLMDFLRNHKRYGELIEDSDELIFGYQ